MKAVFAGGCFWCIEHDFRDAQGVVDVLSGYTGDDEATANYAQVASHTTKHREAVQVTYDDAQTTYKKLVQFFLDHIDPTDQTGQFYDRGESYTPAIYYKTETERMIAAALIDELNESKVYDKPAHVDILEEMPVYPTEEYNQRYAEKNPEHYASYRRGSGKEDFVNRVCQIREEKKINWKD